MNYQKVYNDIIQKAQSENRIKLDKIHNNYIYYENHHILPKCLNGTDDAVNLVLLTAREHYVCHKLLTYIYTHRGIALAFFRMSYDKRNRKVSSRDYIYVKKLIALTPISEETRKKLSVANKRRKVSKETKEKLRISSTGRKHTIQTKKKLSDAKLGEKNPIFGKPSPNRGNKYFLTEEQKNNVSKSLKGKPVKVNSMRKECEYCHKSFTLPCYYRWHGEKCKKKLIMT